MEAVAPAETERDRFNAIRAIEPTLPEIDRDIVEAALRVLNGREGSWSYWATEELIKTVLAAKKYVQQKKGKQKPLLAEGPCSNNLELQQ